MTNQQVEEMTKNLEPAFLHLVKVMGAAGPRHCRNAITRLAMLAAQYQNELSEDEQLACEFKTLQDIYDFFDEVEHGSEEFFEIRKLGS